MSRRFRYAVLVGLVVSVYSCGRRDAMAPDEAGTPTLAVCPPGQVCTNDINQNIDTDADGLKDWEERDLANKYEPAFVFNLPAPPERSSYAMTIPDWANLDGFAIDILYGSTVFTFTDVYSLYNEIFRPRLIGNERFALVVEQTGKFGSAPFNDAAVYYEARPLRYRLDRGAGPESVVWLQYWVYWGINQLYGTCGAGTHHGDWEWIDVLVPRNTAKNEVIATRFQAHNAFEEYRGSPNYYHDQTLPGHANHIHPRVYVESKGHGFHGLPGTSGCNGNYLNSDLVTDMAWLINIGGHTQQNMEPWRTETSILRNFKGYYGRDKLNIGPVDSGSPRGPRHHTTVYGTFNPTPDRFPWTSGLFLGNWVQ
jgi:hypothetical protein